MGRNQVRDKMISSCSLFTGGFGVVRKRYSSLETTARTSGNENVAFEAHDVTQRIL